MRLGVAHHLGWAVAVAASTDHVVHDRRRIELVDPGLPAAPVDDEELASLVARVRASAMRASTVALDELAADVATPILSLSIAAWPPEFPEDVAVQRRVPYESRADSVMYRQVLVDAAERRGWAVHLYEPKSVESAAAQLLGARAHDVLHGPRRALGPPWSKDHRMALAATVLASATES